MIRNKKASLLIFLGVYVVLSLLIIRGSMLVNRGYTFQPSIVEDSIQSLIQVPFALPTGEELTLFALFSSLVAIYGANKYINPKHYRNREEYGSAKWGNVKDLKPYVDKHADDNLLFSKNTKLALDKGRAKRNNNVFVVGGKWGREVTLFGETQSFTTTFQLHYHRSQRRNVTRHRNNV